MKKQKKEEFTPSNLEEIERVYKKIQEKYDNLPQEDKLFWQELEAEAHRRELRNREIYRKRAERVEMISKLTEEEMLEYYKNLERENDEFLKELGINPDDIRR